MRCRTLPSARNVPWCPLQLSAHQPCWPGHADLLSATTGETFLLQSLTSMESSAFLFRVCLLSLGKSPSFLHAVSLQLPATTTSPSTISGSQLSEDPVLWCPPFCTCSLDVAFRQRAVMWGPSLVPSASWSSMSEHVCFRYFKTTSCTNQ